jgi:hypothetical protein
MYGKDRQNPSTQECIWPKFHFVPRQNSDLPSIQAHGRIAQSLLDPCKTGFVARLLVLPFQPMGVATIPPKSPKQRQTLMPDPKFRCMSLAPTQ